MTIELTTWGHAGVRLEREGRRLAVDPGAFTAPEVLDGVTAVLVTHEHPDHVQPEALAAIVAERGDLEVWAPEPVAAALLKVLEASGGAGAAARLHVVAAGDELTAAGFSVRAVGGQHAEIHPSLPPVANVGYLVDGVVLHPGDSFPVLPDGVRVEVLLLPIAAPWLKLSEAVEYARAVAPVLAVPIHDALLSEIGKAAFDRIGGGLVAPVAFRRLVPGEALTVPTP